MKVEMCSTAKDMVTGPTGETSCLRANLETQKHPTHLALAVMVWFV